MRLLLVCCVLLFLTSCNTVRVAYDYDKRTNFNNYTTYNYFSDVQTGLSVFDDRRLFSVLDSTLRAKGFLQVEEPDFYINIQSEEFRSAPSTNNVGVGIGGTNRNMGGGMTIGIPMGRSGLQRQLQFDFVDSQTNKMFWQGVGSANYKEKATPVEREQQIQRVVHKIFSKFPPSKN